MKHNFKKIDPEWWRRKSGKSSRHLEAVDGSDKPKFYGLVEFPYPSGAGMHVGHIKAYSSIEVLCQKATNAGIQCTVPNRIRCIRTSD